MKRNMFSGLSSTLLKGALAVPLPFWLRRVVAIVHACADCRLDSLTRCGRIACLDVSSVVCSEACGVEKDGVDDGAARDRTNANWRSKRIQKVPRFPRLSWLPPRLSRE